MKGRKNDKNFKIFATDLRRWCYCPRQWWYHRALGRKIRVTPAMRRGLERHMCEGKKVEEIRKEQKRLIFYIVGGVICLVLLLYLASSSS